MIGVVCSGGADSSMMLYELSRTLKQIKVFTFVLENNRPYNIIKSTDVINFCKGECDIIHVINYIPAHLSIKEFIENHQSIFEDIDILFTGHTENPPLDEVPPSTESNRDPGVDKEILEHMGNFIAIHPYFNINKKGIVQKYKDYGVYETLWPLTWSCEGSEEHTKYYTVPCNECWWCKEREWSET